MIEDFNLSNTFLYYPPPVSHLTIRKLNLTNNLIRNLWDEDMPQGIEEIIMEYNQLQSDGLLIDWPNTIKSINLSFNPIASIDEVLHWPSQLKILNLSHTELYGIFKSDPLPDSLESLDLSHTHITHIHTFPPALKIFRAHSSRIRVLPLRCPDSLEILDVSKSVLKSGGLPVNWGTSLKFLDMNSNYIRCFPRKLPGTLVHANFSYNLLQRIPEDLELLPASLEFLGLNCNRILFVPPVYDAAKFNYIIEDNCLVKRPLGGNCISASNQWIGDIYVESANMIRRNWFRRRLVTRVRTWKRTATYKSDLQEVAMHPDRAGIFQDISPEWSKGCA